uniref:Peptidase S1 domain-containing protein n=1 Tax=Sciurus vulgaris TaxID=55149 RepID=A0A8D2DR77_SCIVU
ELCASVRLPFAAPSPPLSLGLWFQTCGQTNISCRVEKGKLVEVGKWPWQVSILFLGVYICSGSLIHQQWILTAAHCLQRSEDPTQYSVKVGVQHRPDNTTRLLISRIVIHENYSNLLSQDIALLKLKDAIFWSPLVQPICLPTVHSKLILGSLCWTIGWGLTPKSPYSLQEVAVRIIHNNICNQQYRFILSKDQKQFVGDDMLCAGSELGSDTCQENSGGSLACQVNNTWIQMGVVSWSYRCGGRQRYPGIDTKQIADMRVSNRGGTTPLSWPFLTGCILLVSLGSLWLL